MTRTFESGPETCEIPLSRGLVGIVDADDFERVNRFKWHALKRPRGGRFHVMRSVNSGGIRKTIYLHRWLIGAGVGDEVDHSNNNGLDNRRSNIRLCKRAENARNFLRDSPRKSSQFHGVHWCSARGRWRVVICDTTGKQRHIGMFCDEVEAAVARDVATIAYHGAFAILNFKELHGEIV
jgi:hypothetical protein